MTREAEVREYLATWLHGYLNPKEVNVIAKRSPLMVIFFMIYFPKTETWGEVGIAPLNPLLATT